MYNTVSAAQRQVSAGREGGYIENITGREKASKERYQATRVCLKSEGVNLNLAAQPHFLIFSGHMLQSKSRRAIDNTCAV